MDISKYFRESLGLQGKSTVLTFIVTIVDVSKKLLDKWQTRDPDHMPHSVASGLCP